METHKEEQYRKVIEWFNNFVDYVENNSINIYNEACEWADYLENN